MDEFRIRPVLDPLHKSLRYLSLVTKIHLSRLVITTLLVVAINSSCNTNYFNYQKPPTPPYPTPLPSTPLPEAMVTFLVQLPDNTPIRQPIYLNILDEVTGLALNAKRYEMQAEDDFNYTISIPITVGSVIKYRYSRQGTYTALEQNSAKQPVRYRLLSVEGPGIVRDVVSAWSDTIFNQPTGRIKGVATDSQSGSPIANLLITAGGNQTLTASDGSYLLEGLPPGTHNLVGYALDGAYQPFQQGAVIGAESTTEAPISLSAKPLVNVIFTLIVPTDTMPAVPIRITGNLLQLGNTYADLAGGVSVIASRMPFLSPLPDGRYTITVPLPIGAYVEYKYTLGDGFWNAEQTSAGEFKLRKLIVPDSNIIVEDMVESWGRSNRGPILFDLIVPQNTPKTDQISIQFNPYGWTEPIPMWFLNENHWVYVLYSPLTILDKFGYRYCRNNQCGSADDTLTPGNDHFGRILEVPFGTRTISEQVETWQYWDPKILSRTFQTPAIKPRLEKFIAGIEFQHSFHPSWIPRMPATFAEIRNMGSNWIVLVPTWTYTRSNPPILEQVTGRDALWEDLVFSINQARSNELKVALFPSTQFPLRKDEWWASSQRDFAWWLVWFEHYRIFALHHADLAARQNIPLLVLGGDWVTPALPGASISRVGSSGVPGDAEQRWRELITEIRSHYDGTLAWAIPFSDGIITAPPFLDAVDEIYLLWSTPLASQKDVSEEEIFEATVQVLDTVVRSFQSQVGLPLILAVEYPSADGGITGCLPDPTETLEARCIDMQLLSPPHEDIPTIQLDLDEQLITYSAIMNAVNEKDWIHGFVSRGYYPPASLQDKSFSVHGKPAQDLISIWFAGWLASVEP